MLCNRDEHAVGWVKDFFVCDCELSEVTTSYFESSNTFTESACAIITKKMKNNLSFYQPSVSVEIIALKVIEMITQTL